MFIRSARFYQIRNIADQKIEFHPRTNIIFGENGQGKTNLIEALSFVSNGKSFRTQAARQILRWDCNQASVFAVIEQQHASFEIGIALKEGKKQAFYNGEQISSFSDYLGKLICVSFSPTDLELVKGAPGDRRRFIDRHIIDLRPSLVNEYVTYARALKHKNRLLGDPTVAAQKLEAWNRILAASGSAIHQARLSFVAELQDRVRKIHPSFAPQDGEVSLYLSGSFAAAGQAALDPQGAYDAFSAHAQREIATRSAKFGPHRDDMTIELAAQNSRAFASQGQARSLVLSLKLAVIEMIEEHKGESPVVLLDDVDSELDRLRSEAFFGMVMSGQRQLFITGTEAQIAGLSEPGSCAVMRVEGGNVSELASRVP